MATAGSIVVDLLMRTGSFETDTRRAERQMRQLQRKIDRTVKRIGMYGLAVAGTFAAAMKSANNYMAEIGMAAERTSVSAQAFSELAYAAEQASLSQGELERILRRSTEAINHGIKGGSKQAEALKKLGISAYDAAGNVKTADQMLKDMAERFSQLEPSAQKTGLVIDLFGMQLGQKVIPLLNQGADGLDEMAKKARELGIVIDDEAAQAANDFETSLGDLKKAALGLSIALAQDAVPWLTEMVEQFRLGIQYSDGFFDALMKYGTASPYLSPEEHLQRVQEELEELDATIADVESKRGNFLDKVFGGSADRSLQTLYEIRRGLEQELGYWRELAQREFDEGFVGPQLPTRRMETIDVTLSDTKKAARTSARIDEGQRYIQQLHERIALLGKETEYERLLAQMSVGAINFRTQAQEQEAIAQAQTLDFLNEQMRAVEEAKLQAEEYQALMHRLYPEQAEYERFIADVELLHAALERGLIDAELYSDALTRLAEDTSARLTEINGSFWEKYLLAAEESLMSFDDLSKSVIEGFSGRFGDAFEKIIFDTESMGDAFSSLAQGMARSIVNALGQMAAQWVAYQAVQLLVGRSTQASGAAALAANASATSLQAGLAAFASTAAIPIIGPALAPGAMAAAIGITAPVAAAVGTTALAGMAHDGIDSIPKTGTWLLEKGERVVTSETSARLDSVLRRIEANQLNSPVKQPAGVTVNLIESHTRAGEVESKTSDDGEQELNIFVADIRGGGKRSQALEATYGLTRIGR